MDDFEPEKYECKENNEPVALKKHLKPLRLPRKEKEKYLRAVEGRNGHEIENREHDIDDDDNLQKSNRRNKLDNLKIHNEPDGNREYSRERKIAQRSRERDEHAPLSRILETAGIERDGFCPSENDSSRNEGKKERQNNRSERIEVFYRVQGEPARPARGVVSQFFRGKSVGNLVHHHRKNKHENLKYGEEKRRIHVRNDTITAPKAQKMI